MRQLRTRAYTADRLGNVGVRRPPVVPREPTAAAPRQPAAYTALVEQLGEQPPGSVPCVGESRHLWLSDSAADQDRAVAACRKCPLIELCRRAGRGEHGGVWGGVRPRKSPYDIEDDTEEAA
ncbi:WhiB family transcriptional regulator [Micropruina sp.]|uniref:WhiB family transcriptional regulator n=1 Tax=Micropruina sp. TaxID=2737536 RepID=UPI0039E640C1